MFLSVYSHFGMLLSSRPWIAVYYFDEFRQTHQKTTSNIDCVDPDSYKRFHDLENTTKTHILFLLVKKKKCTIFTWNARKASKEETETKTWSNNTENTWKDCH